MKTLDQALHDFEKAREAVIEELFKVAPFRWVLQFGEWLDRKLGGD